MSKKFFLSVKILILAAVCFAASASAQTSELVLEEGVRPHKGIDAIYREFSRGYRELKPEMVANLYSPDAAYLVPDDDITNGRPAILDNFTGFFERVRDRGQQMTISFRILQRQVEKNLGYDVGIYTLKYYKDGRMQRESKGKFVVVAVKGKDKKWYFQVDGYSGLKPATKN